MSEPAEQSSQNTNAELARMDEIRGGDKSWRRWGPYLSERQWGTVREDYSAGGDAWSYLPHDDARSRAYRWGEDGIGGLCDERQLLCFALALWNEKDPILKERAFGLTNSQGNHGEDVKEYYFFVDNVPSHAYMRMVYKYPHNTYPYDDLIQENQRRRDSSTLGFEYELLDTGIFEGNAYCDVTAEYAKVSQDDVQIRITVANRGTEQKTIRLLPTLWFRNTWSWSQNASKPSIAVASNGPGTVVLKASGAEDLSDMFLYCDSPNEVLFVDNETNAERLFGSANTTQYPKDGINNYIVQGQRSAVNPQQTGSKASAHYAVTLGPGESRAIRLRLSSAGDLSGPFEESDATFAKRLQEADDFYAQLNPYETSDERRAIQRQAFAGMLWCKQTYHYVVEDWMKGDPVGPAPPSQRLEGRNHKWQHFYAEDVLTMPDSWEYPWFASWDLCFHTVVFSMIDPEFAKDQLMLLAKEWYMHPDGQVPAYEWNFEDVNPPVHAWAAWHVYLIERKIYGRADREFLEHLFQRCLLYFTWWLNRKDEEGKNLFAGGFLGLDNIGLFNRDELPPGSTLYQSDATSWMGLFALTMVTIALELAEEDSSYASWAVKFLQNFVYIADALNSVEHLSSGEAKLWDEKDGFYYDVLRTSDGKFETMRARTLVGLMPLFATGSVDQSHFDSIEFAEFGDRVRWFLNEHQELASQVTDMDPLQETITSTATGRVLFALVDEDRLRTILKRMLDENEFLSPHGIRSVSKYYEQNPYYVTVDGVNMDMEYAPAESTSHMFGGNSNWRGPIWFPINFLLIESLQRYHYALGDGFTVECPTGSGNQMTLAEVADEIGRRLVSIFERDSSGKRPVYGGTEIFQSDPQWRDYVLFYEYFHGDNGAGLGASHQTGWTGLVAKLISDLGEHSGKK